MKPRRGPPTRGRGGSVYGGGDGYTATFAETGQSIGYADANGLEEVEVWDCDLSCPVAELDRQSGERVSGGYPPAGGQRSRMETYGQPNERGEPQFGRSAGAASRFFYVSKASAAERSKGLDALPLFGDDGLDLDTTDDGRQTPIDNPYQRGQTKRRNIHPCVKPLALCEYLVKLVTPPGGTVLDPFAGSGSIGLAAMRLGFSFIGIERESQYIEIAKRRLGLLPFIGEEHTA